MPVKNYVSRNGQIEYEIDEAGEILTYGRDALGNVVAGYDKNTNAVFTIDYKPFGEFAATTGTITGRRFLWVGTWGYRFTPGVPVSHYVRARHLMMRMGMWTSVDPLWPVYPAYEYCNSDPLMFVDPMGLEGIRPDKGWEPKPPKFIPKWFPDLRRWTPSLPGRVVFGPPPPPENRSNPLPTLYLGNEPLDMWSYGNYCGQKTWKHGNCRPLPKDCMDAACQEHDDCLEVASGYFSRQGTHCNCRLAARALSCILGGCGGWNSGGLRGYTECQSASKQVFAIFSAICSFGSVRNFRSGGRPKKNDDPLVWQGSPNERPDPWRVWRDEPISPMELPR